MRSIKKTFEWNGRKKNTNAHYLVVKRKAQKENRLAVLVDTLKALGKNAKQIKLALVKSGAKVRDARRIYKNAA